MVPEGIPWKNYTINGACALASVLIGQRGGALRGIIREQKDAVQQLFESNGWPWNAEVTDVCEAESTALCTSLDNPHSIESAHSYSNCPPFKAFES